MFCKLEANGCFVVVASLLDSVLAGQEVPLDDRVAEVSPDLLTQSESSRSVWAHAIRFDNLYCSSRKAAQRLRSTMVSALNELQKLRLTRDQLVSQVRKAAALGLQNDSCIRLTR